MEQPSDFVDSSFPDHVCKLHKSIKGLMQAPRAWFNQLATTFIGLGFIESKVDYSVLILHKSNVHLFRLIYVDDIIVTGNSVTANLITKMPSRVLDVLGVVPTFICLKLCLSKDVWLCLLYSHSRPGSG